MEEFNNDEDDEDIDNIETVTHNSIHPMNSTPVPKNPPKLQRQRILDLQEKVLEKQLCTYSYMEEYYKLKVKKYLLHYI